MFAHQETRAFTSDGSILTLNSKQEPSQETPEEAISSFVDFIEVYSINEYECVIAKPLRLHDCWDDDPIASGDLQIFKDSNLPASDLQELQNIFGSFHTPIYYEHVMNRYSHDQLENMLANAMARPIYAAEFNKRMNRMRAIGCDPKVQIPMEIVWVDLTLKVRDWALSKRYDSFVYTNQGEDKGVDSYILLNQAQGSPSGKVHHLNKQKYLNNVGAQFGKFLSMTAAESASRTTAPITVQNHVFWGGQNPTGFWCL